MAKAKPAQKKASKAKKTARKPAPMKQAAPKKKVAAKKKAVAKKPSRFCLGKCSCGSPCTYDSGHSGSHYCSFHAPNA